MLEGYFGYFCLFTISTYSACNPGVGAIRKQVEAY